MNTHKKLLIAYYAKQITATLGVAFLYSLSMITGSSEGLAKINAYYKKVSESIQYPVTVKMTSVARNQVKVA
jgi:hypothetical protein